MRKIIIIIFLILFCINCFSLYRWQRRQDLKDVDRAVIIETLIDTEISYQGAEKQIIEQQQLIEKQKIKIAGLSGQTKGINMLMASIIGIGILAAIIVVVVFLSRIFKKN